MGKHGFPHGSEPSCNAAGQSPATRGELHGASDAHRRASIHWKVAPPSGSVIVTSSSRSSSKPASRSMRLFTSGGKLEK